MLTAYVVALAAEEHVNESVPNHWIVGGIALGILLLLLLALLVFGAGREHS
jgi:hypothetical protein